MGCGFGSGKHSCLYKQARHWPPKLLLEPFARVDQTLERNTGFESRPMQQVEQVLGGDIPGCSGREGAAADSAHAGIENLDTRLGCGVRVRQPRVARIVEMAAELEPRECSAHSRHEVCDLRWNACSNRVGEC